MTVNAHGYTVRDGNGTDRTVPKLFPDCALYQIVRLTINIRGSLSKTKEQYITKMSLERYNVFRPDEKRGRNAHRADCCYMYLTHQDLVVNLSASVIFDRDLSIWHARVCTRYALF